MPAYPWSDLSDLSSLTGSSGGYDLNSGMPLDPQAIIALQALAKKKAAEQQAQQQVAQQAQQPAVQRPESVQVPTDSPPVQQPATQPAQTGPQAPVQAPQQSAEQPAMQSATEAPQPPSDAVQAELDSLRTQQAQEEAAKASQQPASAPQGAQPSQQQDFSGPFDYATYAKRLTSGVETNGDPNSKDPNSSASGLYSFTDDGWADFLKSPGNTGHWTAADKNNPDAQNAALQWETTRNVSTLRGVLGTDPTYGQVWAAHFLGEHGAAATLRANPNARFVESYPDAWKAAAANPSILNSNMTNAQALASIDSYFKTAKGNGNLAGALGRGTMAAGPGVAIPDAPPRVQLPDWLTQGLPNVGVQDLAQNYQANPSPADMYLAIGAGLSGAPTLGKGFAAAAQNVLGLKQSYQKQNASMLGTQMDAQLKGAGIQAEMARLMPKPMGQPYKGADGNMYQMVMSPGGIPVNIPINGTTVGQQRVDNTKTQGDARIAQGDRRLDQGDARLGLQKVGLDLRRQALEGLQSGATPGAAALAKSNVASMNKLFDSVPEAQGTLQDISDLRTLLQQEGSAGLVGPSYIARAKRVLAQALGTSVGGVTPDAIALSDKMLSDLRNTGTMAYTKGSMPRSALEMGMIQKAFGSDLSTPDALNVIFQRAERMANATVGTFNAWNQLSASGATKAALEPYGGNFSAWKAAHESIPYVAQGSSGQDGTTPSPMIQQKPGGQGWQSTQGAAGTPSKPPLSSFWSK